MSALQAVPSNRDTALEGLYDDVAKKHMFPFWAGTAGVEHDEIKRLMATKKAVPHLWDFANDIHPILRRAADLVKMDDSERRSVILINPGLAPRRASVSTMYSSYRLNDPHEIMPPHKHSPSAIRFGLIGEGNFTGVQGEDVVFGPGDIVLTPNDTWHNHGTVGDNASVNLSILDLPLVEMLHGIHFDHDYTELEDGQPVKKKVQTATYRADYSQKAYGEGGMLPRFLDHKRGSGLSSPMYVYRWDRMEELLDRHRELDGDPYDALMAEYTDPTTGQPVFKTITFFAQMLRPGEHTRPTKQTASLLVTPFKGEGYSIVDGQRYDWKQYDTIAIPGQSWYEHVNTGTSPLFFFVASDEPTLKALSLYKKWGRDTSGDVVRIVGPHGA